jgi:hypothetical protein
MKRLFTAPVAALAILLLGGVGAQANPIPPDSITWTYNFTPVTPGTHTPLAAVFADGNPGAGVNFTNDSTQSVQGSSDIVATTLHTFSSALPAHPDRLTANGSYDLDLQLSATDDNGVHTALLTFHGNKLSGPFSSANSKITNMFGADATQSVNLGVYTFSVSLDSYVPPGPQSQGLKGSIGATVTVTGNTITAAQVPEPTSLLLSSLGLTFLGGMAWRKRRRARAV